MAHLGGQSGLSCSVTLTGTAPGVCGSLNGSGIYDANNSGDAITGGSL